MEHLTERLTTQFLFGRATRDEVRAVVRHLLTQCPRCATLARRILVRPPIGSRKLSSSSSLLGREAARASSSFPERLSGKLPGQQGGCSGLFQIPGERLVCPADSWNLEPLFVLSAGREAGPFPHPSPLRSRS